MADRIQIPGPPARQTRKVHKILPLILLSLHLPVPASCLVRLPIRYVLETMSTPSSNPLKHALSREGKRFKDDREDTICLMLYMRLRPIVSLKSTMPCLAMDHGFTRPFPKILSMHTQRVVFWINSLHWSKICQYVFPHRQP